MQTAKGTLKLNDFNTVQVTDITPVEAVLLNKKFKAKGGGLSELEYTGEAKDVTATLAAVRAKHGKEFAVAFPGEAPKLPATFAEVKLAVKGLAGEKPMVDKPAPVLHPSVK